MKKNMHADDFESSETVASHEANLVESVALHAKHERRSGSLQRVIVALPIAADFLAIVAVTSQAFSFFSSWLVVFLAVGVLVFVATTGLVVYRRYASAAVFSLEAIGDRELKLLIVNIAEGQKRLDESLQAGVSKEFES